MDVRDRSNAARNRLDVGSWVVPVALFLPVVLLLFVAGMTWRSEQRAAAVTDRVIHDYSGIAVWQYARRSNVALHDEVMRAFMSPRPAGKHHKPQATPVNEIANLATPCPSCTSTFRRNPVFAFKYDPRTGSFETAGDTVGSATMAMLRQQLRASGESEENTEPHRVLFGSADGRDYAIAVSGQPEPQHIGAVVCGIATDSKNLAPMFDRVLGEPQLLPSINGSPAAAQNQIAVQVTRSDGVVVFSTPHAPGRTAASDSLGLAGGTLRPTLDLSQQLAHELLIGGIPRSQLPAIGLLILVASILAVVGLIHHRRSRALSIARSRFVATTSHELRTPLAQISMFAETLYLGRERSEAERKQFAGILFAEARRLTALVENVLRFSRGEHSERALSPRPNDVASLIANAVNVFSPIASMGEARIEASVPPGLIAHVDSSAFQQIMLNLLDNAVKHGGGRVVIEAQARENEICVTVDDAGPGVPAEWRSRVFEPFSQVAGRNMTGAGIGLAIVRDLIQSHGGSVSFETSPLGGARVVVLLPRNAEAVALHGVTVAQLSGAAR